MPSEYFRLRKKMYTVKNTKEVIYKQQRTRRGNLEVCGKPQTDRLWQHIKKKKTYDTVAVAPDVRL